MFEFCETKLPGCFLIRPRIFSDIRGEFVKTFHSKEYVKHGLESVFVEDFYTTSQKNVIRGLHLAKPPSSHVKTVSCVSGKIFDVLLDLRLGSPTFGQYATFVLSSKNANILYAPEGIAHGFCAMSDITIVQYKVSKTFCAEDDIGVLWSSAKIPWPTSNPILSDRDMIFPALADFASPFFFDKYQA